MALEFDPDRFDPDSIDFFREQGWIEDPTRDEYNSRFPENYLLYIKSPHWRAKREEVFDFYRGTLGVCCAFCCGIENLEVHHRRYPEKFDAPLSDYMEQPVTDFLILCRDHHRSATQISRKHRGAG